MLGGPQLTRKPPRVHTAALGAALPSGGPTAIGRASVPAVRSQPPVCPQPHPGEGPSVGADLDNGWRAVPQVQEQGHHALVYLGPQAAQLPAGHGSYQVPEQRHGCRPDPSPLLQGGGSEPQPNPPGSIEPNPHPARGPSCGGDGAHFWLQSPFPRFPAPGGRAVPPLSDRFQAFREDLNSCLFAQGLFPTSRGRGAGGGGRAARSASWRGAERHLAATWPGSARLCVGVSGTPGYPPGGVSPAQVQGSWGSPCL